jgi:pyridoxal phosphate enzyme (YggS family)
MTVAINLNNIRHRMAQAAQVAGRDPATVKLVTVSKTKTEGDVHTAILAGQKIFGENRVQEAKEKFTGLCANHPDIRLHLIGALQTNKAEDAVRLFDVIETLDRPKLAAALASAIKKIGRAPQCFIEINSGDEAQKAGIAPTALGDFLTFCREGCGLNVTGLMTIPPQHKDPIPYFQHLRDLAKQYELPNISMGMSADFEAAIACGATEIRIGTAIFGGRAK